MSELQQVDWGTVTKARELRVLVCGSRDWEDFDAIMRVMVFLQGAAGHGKEIVVIHGACRGADQLADRVAKYMGFETEPYPADWDAHGRAAGPIRNQQMLDDGQPDLVLAFHPDIKQSRGTKDMVNRARKAGIPVRIYTR